MLETLKPYLCAAEAGPEDFVAHHPHPVFVVLPFSQQIEDTGVVTLVGSALKATLTSVGPVRKRKGANAFGSMITIGRARNNDIEIKASDISKTHAFILEKEGAFQLVDSGSTNGTFHQGKRLAPRTERIALESGDEVLFAKVKTIFFSPAAFFEYLAEMEDEPT